jgi:hypothetical protein
VTAVSYLTGCETWLVGNDNMPWGERFSVPRQIIRGEFGIQAAKVAIFFAPNFNYNKSILK